MRDSFDDDPDLARFLATPHGRLDDSGPANNLLATHRDHLRFVLISDVSPTRLGWHNEVTYEISARRDRRASWGHAGRPLALRIAVTLFVLAFLGRLAAMTALPWIAGGSPADAVNGSAYRLANHGTYSCVSRSAYEQAGAGVQRFATGILLAFYSLHAGAALCGLQQRRAIENTK